MNDLNNELDHSIIRPSSRRHTADENDRITCDSPEPTATASEDRIPEGTFDDREFFDPNPACGDGTN